MAASSLDRPAAPSSSWFPAALLLALWTALLSVFNGLWLRAHTFSLPPAWDHALYLYLSLRFSHALQDGGLRQLLVEFVQRSQTVAPLFPLSTVLCYLGLGESREVAQLALAPYLFLLLLGVFLFAWRSDPGPDARCGFLAAFMVSTFTGVVNFSREYMMDLPSTATATLGLYALWRSQGFTRRRVSAAAGALLGLTLLTKILTGALFLGPVVFSLGRSLRAQRRAGPVLAGLGLFMATVALIAAIWYGPHYRDILHYVAYFGFGEGSQPFRAAGPSLLSLSNLLYYARVLVFHGLGIFYSGLLALVLFWSLRLPRGSAGAPRSVSVSSVSVSLGGPFLWSWLVCGYLILTLLPNKGGERYVLGLLPPIAVLLARSIWRVKERSLHGGLTVLALLAGGLNYAALTWETPLSRWAHPHFDPFPHTTPLSPSARSGWPVSELMISLAGIQPAAGRRPEPGEIGRFLESTEAVDDNRFVRAAYRFLLRRDPDPAGLADYQSALTSGALTRRGLMESLLASKEFRSRPLKVLVAPDHRVINASTLGYLAEAERRPVSFTHLSSTATVRERIWEFDAVVVKEGGSQGPAHETRALAEVEAALRQRAPDWQSSPHFACPDGSHVRIIELPREAQGDSALRDIAFPRRSQRRAPWPSVLR